MRIISFGAVYLDINAMHFPIPNDVNKLIGTETVGPSYEIVLGGSAVNFVRFCKKLGHTGFFIGKVGKDKSGKILTNLFKEENIIPALSQDATKQTNLNTNIVSDNNSSIMLSFGSANQSLAKKDVMDQLEKHINDIDLLYLGGVFKLKNLLPSLTEIVGFVKSNQKKVVLDHGRIVNTVTDTEKDIVKEMAMLSDYYLPSKDEFLELWNVATIDDGLHLFADKPVTVVVKDGENGAYSMTNNAIVHVPAFAVDAVNSIGAGDSFNAGFITAQLEGKSLEESIRFAHAVAALKISQDDFPTRDDIDNLLKKS